MPDVPRQRIPRRPSLHRLRRVLRSGRIVLTRHGAVAGDRVRVVAAPARPWLWMLVGSLVLGSGVALLIRAELGLPPYDVLLSAIAGDLGLSHGQAGLAFGAALLAVATMLGRRPRLATLAWIAGNGMAVDAALPLVQAPDSMLVRIVFAVAGTCAIAGGVSLVIHSGGTGGAFELIIAALGDRGLRPVPVRTGLELTTLVTGLALAGDAGLFTLAFALVFGPLVVASLRALEDHQIGREFRLHPGRSEVPALR